MSINIAQLPFLGLKGIVGTFVLSGSLQNDVKTVKKKSELLRPLEEYEAIAGGAW